MMNDKMALYTFDFYIWHLSFGLYHSFLFHSLRSVFTGFINAALML